MSALTDIGRAAMARGGTRAATLDSRPMPRRAILRAIPTAIEKRFDATAAAGLSAVFELRVAQSEGGPETRFGLRVSGGSLTVTRGTAPDAGAAVTISAADMILLGSGAVPWPVLLAEGRLVLSGDPFLALRFPQLFGFSASPRT